MFCCLPDLRCVISSDAFRILISTRLQRRLEIGEQIRRFVNEPLSSHDTVKNVWRNNNTGQDNADPVPINSQQVHEATTDWPGDDINVTNEVAVNIKKKRESKQKAMIVKKSQHTIAPATFDALYSQVPANFQRGSIVV